MPLSGQLLREASSDAANRKRKAEPGADVFQDFKDMYSEGKWGNCKYRHTSFRISLKKRLVANFCLT
jgi:hypothetical protein